MEKYLKWFSRNGWDADDDADADADDDADAVVLSYLAGMVLPSHAQYLSSLWRLMTFNCWNIPFCNSTVEILTSL